MRSTYVLIGWALVGAMASVAAAEPPPAPGPRARPATAPTTGPVTKAEVDQLFQPLIDGDWVPGVVVGILTEDGRRVYGYGRVSEKDGRTPDGRTVYEIGSVSKVFTSLLLADMARRGEVALDDPVQKYLPESVRIPRRGDKPITLQHLATHTSGLPRMPGNFAPKDPANPYADYTVEQMYAFLNECKPARDPGGAYEYSNLGVGLLGHALALRAGKPYEELLAERIARPLGLTDTRITLTADQRNRMASGHDADGGPQANWDIPTFAGAGAIRSTADDLLTFLAAQAGITPADKVGPDLAAAIAMTQEKRAAVGPGLDIGLGWHGNTKDDLLWHNGQTGGYHSFVAFSRGRKIGVVVLTNASTGAVEAHGNALLRRLLGFPLVVPELPTAVAVAPDVLERYVGQYLTISGAVLTVAREGDRLYARLTGQPRVRIYPRSETSFFFKVVDARIDFAGGPEGGTPGGDGAARPGGGPLMRLTLHQNGHDVPALRMKADSPLAEPSTRPSTRPAGSEKDEIPGKPAAPEK